MKNYNGFKKVCIPVLKGYQIIKNFIEHNALRGKTVVENCRIVIKKRTDGSF